MKTQTVYRSSNGDDWLLSSNGDGGFTVIHRAIASSGGTETTMPVEEFLARSGGSPEALAVRKAYAAEAVRPGEGGDSVDPAATVDDQ